MSEGRALDKEYSQTYYNYHRNALLLFGLCSAIWFFNVEIDLASAAWIKNSNNILTQFIPWILFFSGFYCFIVFSVEWKIQSESHFTEIGDDLRRLGSQFTTINLKVEEYSENLNEVKAALENVKRVTDRPEQILITNQREIYSRYRDHFRAKVSVLAPHIERLQRRVEQIEAEIENLYADPAVVEREKKRILLQNLSYVSELYYTVQGAVASIDQDTLGYGEMIESPLDGQSAEFRQLCAAITESSNKVGKVYIENESFAEAISYFRGRSRVVRTMVIVKVFLAGIGSIVIMFVTSVFSMIYHYAPMFSW